MDKEKLLDILASHDGYVSGELLCQLFQVSRAAIWKNMQALRAEGYPIEAVTRKGYRLHPCADLLSQALLEKMIREQGLHTLLRQVAYQGCVDSTNLLARRALEEQAVDDCLFVAGRQTAGRGRRGRQWLSSHEQGLWFTLLLQPREAVSALSQLTLLTGLAVSSALQTDFNLPVGIKWPNDLVSRQDGRKLGGILSEILIEDQSARAVIVGIGLNLNQMEFPPELSVIATSMKQMTGKSFRRLDVLASLLQVFAGLYPQLGCPQSWMPEYRRSCLTLGQQVQALGLNGSVLEGRAVDIDAAGELILEDKAGQRQTVRSGEVSVRGLMGRTDF